MAAEMTTMSCRNFDPASDRCRSVLRYVSNFSQRVEMYARNGFIASPIALRANLQATMRRGFISQRRAYASPLVGIRKARDAITANKRC